MKEDPLKMMKTLVAALCLIVLPLLKAGAAVPLDPSKELLLLEKSNLSAAVIDYKGLVHDHRLDMAELQANREWIEVEISRLKDRGQKVPSDLKRSNQQINRKLAHRSKEIKRLNGMTSRHLKELRDLDARVKGKYGQPAPEWWGWDDRVYAWMYPGKNEAKRVTAQRVPEPDMAVEETSLPVSALAEELGQKVKKAGIDNWVALIPGEKELKLEVQLPILFGLGKSEVASDYKAFFHKLALLLKPYTVRIEALGYGDSQEKHKKNISSDMALGLRRAANVVKEMANKGLPASIFRISGENDYAAHDPEKKQLSAAMKRRVEVNVFFKNNGA